MSLTLINITCIILGTLLVMLGLVGAYRFVDNDPFIFVWIIVFVFGYSTVQYGILQLAWRNIL